MRFPPSFLDEIRARVPVSAVVSQKVKLKKHGREWRGLSPFNAEKTPSFYVIDEKGFFHDFSSGKSGDGFTFLMETEGLTFPEAVEKLAGMAGLPMPVETKEARELEEKRASLGDVLEWAAQFFEAQLRGSAVSAARAYLSNRAIGESDRARFRLGFAPPERHALRDHLAGKGASVEAMIEAGLLVHGEDIVVPYDRFRDRIMFPICDRAGRVIAFGGRAMQKDAQAKYLNSPETPLFHKGATLYNQHNARKAAHEAGYVVAVEGYVDVIAMTAAGFPQTVAPLGTALTAEQCALLWTMAEEPILCFDGDKAGRKAADRAIDTALPLLGPGRSFRFALLPDGQDPDELFRAGGAAAIAEAIGAARPLVDLLWARETEGARLDTPERRAALERRFAELARSIADEALRRHYSQELNDRCATLFGRSRNYPPRREWRSSGGGGRGPMRRFNEQPSLRGPLTIGASLARSPLFRGQAAAIAPREALILIILLNHPQLLQTQLEAVAALDLDSAEARELRAALIRCAADGTTDREAIEREIAAAGLEAFCARLANMTAHASLWNVRAGAAATDAAESLRQALILQHRARALHKELRKIESRLADAPSDHDFARLSDIQAQLNTIEGTEAMVEGFGSLSGRTTRTV
ncbi:DNA primase [Methylosinus sp. Sm6]|uniref:DNA primase n=1 Tax=Methylosinus sp. Sm6 TaxID=2866948 RepID=UPI001C99617E|nr:DNA primase [Methylosinus sp. Sm6]MBY6241369.1 DNA primase [Methylosinus sp. Sm6]